MAISKIQRVQYSFPSDKDCACQILSLEQTVQKCMNVRKLIVDVFIALSSPIRQESLNDTGNILNKPIAKTILKLIQPEHSHTKIYYCSTVRLLVVSSWPSLFLLVVGKIQYSKNLTLCCSSKIKTAPMFQLVVEHVSCKHRQNVLFLLGCNRDIS